jgi:3D (Asp-Asp-Asp) domain-containing protein
VRVSLIILALIGLSGPSAFAREQSLLARVTVYWAGGAGSDRYTRQHRCATGLRLQHGHCAVDPRKIPYGSRVIFPDGTALAAVDTGSAVRNRKAARLSGRTTYERGAIVVDRFFETRRQAMIWANRNPQFMTVRVVPADTRLIAQRPARLAISNQIINSQTIPATKPATTAALNPPASARLASNAMIVRSPFNKLGK